MPRRIKPYLLHASVRARSVRELAVEDEGIGVDVDTLEALAEAEKRVLSRA
jgi:hypothetical protein